MIRTCLAKDPDERFQTARDLKRDLLWAMGGESASSAPARSQFGKTGWVVAAVATLALAALAFVHFREKPAAQVVTRFEYPLPEGQSFTRAGRHDIAISPDGTKIVYVANQQLYLRGLNELTAQPVPGTTEDPMEPFFSPDGQWLAYFVPALGANTSPGAGAWVLKKIAISGGAPVTLGTLPAAPYGATWRDATIAFGMNTANLASVQAIPDSGGDLRTLVSADLKKEHIMQPQLMADGKHLLLVSVPPETTGGSEGKVIVQTLGGKDRRTLIEGGADPRLLPTGQLVYIHDGTLLAVPFDVNRLTVTGSPVPLVEGVTEAITTWAGQFAISSNGTLAYRPGLAAGAAQSVLVWVDRQGREEPIPLNPRDFVYPRVSPDGTKIAVDARGEEHDVWVYDLAKDTFTRVSFGPAWETHPIWMLDGKSLLFSSGPNDPDVARGLFDIVRKAADGTGANEPLTEHLSGGYPMSLTPDGKSLVFTESGYQLFLLPLNPRAEARPLITSPVFNFYNGEVSPDGHWIAYDSNESGRFEVYVRPFPAVDSGKWQISGGEGQWPVWSRSGRELFFEDFQKRMFSVPVQPGSYFTYGKPQQLFDAGAYLQAVGRPFDVSPDGKRFVMVKNAHRTSATELQSIVVVSHWFDEVKTRMPAQR